MPEKIKAEKLYEPGKNTRENSQRDYLKKNWEEKYDYWQIYELKYY